MWQYKIYEKFMIYLAIRRNLGNCRPAHFVSSNKSEAYTTNIMFDESALLLFFSPGLVLINHSKDVRVLAENIAYFAWIMCKVLK